MQSNKGFWKVSDVDSQKIGTSQSSGSAAMQAHTIEEPAIWVYKYEATADSNNPN